MRRSSETASCAVRPDRMPDPITRTTPSPPTEPSEPFGPGAPPHPPAPAPPTPDEPLPAAARPIVDRFAARTPSSSLSTIEARAGWYGDKVASEVACHLLPPALALRAAELRMPDGGLAEKMLNHFPSGSAAPVHVDLNAELARNPELREYVASRIEVDVSERVQTGEALADMSGATLRLIGVDRPTGAPPVGGPGATSQGEPACGPTAAIAADLDGGGAWAGVGWCVRAAGGGLASRSMTVPR